MNSVIKGKDQDLESALIEKNAEIQRLEGVIRVKETENEALREKVTEKG